MKSIGAFLLGTCLLASTDTGTARAVRIWSYQELLDKSDLVVIASPTATKDIREHIELPGFDGQHVVGVETRFAVSAVLKGDQATKEFVFHHYHPATNGMIVPNGPTFVSFSVPKEPKVFPRTYVLFLLREVDGRYAPVVGQADPGMGIRELGGVYESPVTETRTKLGLDIEHVLKECQTVKPGMTRAELSKVFSTEGGLSNVTHRTYVYRDCPYIKVDVDFTPSAPNQDAEKPTDVVTRVSKPYLGWSIAD